MLLFGAAWLLPLFSRRTKRSGGPQRVANVSYAGGAIVMAVHIVLAYGISHQWSHQAALADTAASTRAVLGVGFAYGLYANFIFEAVYLIDAGWRWRVAAPEHRKPKWLSRSIDGFLVAIVFFATVVFESGAVRYVALTAFAAYGLAACYRAVSS